jgi:YD repeat-containing protein
LSFSEQDLVVPVNGIPLTVVRTYNSFNALSPRPSDGRGVGGEGDFGPGWTYALNDMDVVIDEDRRVVAATAALDGADDPYDNSALNFSLRTSGGRNVTLTLPDGRRTTFLFNLVNTADSEDLPGCLDAHWTAAPGVHATLSTPNPTTSDGPGDNTLICLPGLPPVWSAGYASTPMEAYDFPTLILTLQDGTKFRIDRDPPSQPQSPTYVYQDEAGDFDGGTYYIQPHPGKPRLTRIEQRTGDQIIIGDTSIEHRNTNNVPTRTIRFERDTKNRITALRDPVAGTNGLPAVKYVYNEDTGNLIRVLRLVDRTAGSYLTNVYHYDHPKFPHYITAIDDARGIPAARNLYDDNGKLIGIIDADGRTNTITHNLTNRIEQIVDRLGNTNSFAYDTRGNVTAITNALGTSIQQISTFGYDNTDNRIAATNTLGVVARIGYDTNGLPLFVTNAFGGSLQRITTYTYDGTGNPLVATDARGYSTTNSYDSRGLLLTVGNSDGIVVTNTYDPTYGWLVRTADATGVVTTNYYDPATGNLTRSSVGYYSGSTWNALATTTYGYDANGNQIAVTNALGVETRFGHDAQNRLIAITNAFGLAEQSTNATIYDANGRVAQTVNALGIITAFGYDAQGRRTSVTNALGKAVQQVTTYAYDATGNRTNLI